MQGWVFHDVAATPDNPNAAAIDDIFTEGGKPLAFDVTGLDGAGLNQILDDLAALTVGRDGNLEDAKP